MDARYAPSLSSTLQAYRLHYIPEAHNYLKHEEKVFDFTNKKSKPEDFIYQLLEEIEITPEQITDFKVNYHKKYLSDWLNDHPQIDLTLEELWNVREQCIQKLSANGQ
jgi:hypothetical protein